MLHTCQATSWSALSCRQQQSAQLCHARASLRCQAHAAADSSGSMPARRRRRVPLKRNDSRQQRTVSSRPPSPAPHGSADRGDAPAPSSELSKGASRQQLSLLTYNVWFREDVGVHHRMDGIGEIIAASGYPTFVCFQEVTPDILFHFEDSPWWEKYECSPVPHQTYFTALLVNKAAVTSSTFNTVDFNNTGQGRGLVCAHVTVDGKQMLVANTHLESPIARMDLWYSQTRREQVASSLQLLQKELPGNVLFAGDMNWNDSRDGNPSLPPGWCDAWLQLHPSDPGYTYHAKNNPMLPFKGTPPLRLDRIFASLSDFKLASVSIVGKEPLVGKTYRHTYRDGRSRDLPLLPSDHFGLLLKLDKL